MATDLGQAYVQIIPSAKGISGEIAKVLDPEATSAGESAGRKTGTAMKVALTAAVVGIGAIVGKAITEGGELEQNLGGTEAVFGNYAKNIQSSASEAYKNMGLSASDYMATANKMGSLFQGSGMDQQKSLDLTSDAMQRAADVASVMGIDTSAAMESIAGAAKGNFTMMDNLGVAMNATSLQAYALEKGINFEWNTASQAEKSELAMQMFMERTSQYAGNFARESEETFTGSLGAMKSSWQNVLGSLATGQDIEPALTALSTSLVTFVQNLMPMVTSILTQLPTIIVTLLTEAGPQLMETGAQAVASILSGIAQTLPTLIPVAIEAILTIVNTLIENLPLIVDSALQLITGLAEGLVAAIPVIVEKIPEIIDSIIGAIVELLPLIIEAGIQLFVSLIEALPEIISTIVAALPKIINSIVDTLIGNIDKIIQAGVDLLIALIENLPTIIVEIVKRMPEIIAAMVEALGKGVSKFAQIGGDLIRGLWQGIKDAGAWLWDKISGFFGGVVDKIKGFFGIGSPSKMFGDEIGHWLPAGIAVGIEDNTRVVTDAMTELGEMAVSQFNPDLSLAAVGGDYTTTFNHQGTIRVEGVNNRDELVSVVDIVMSELRREARAWA